MELCVIFLGWSFYKQSHAALVSALCSLSKDDYSCEHMINFKLASQQAPMLLPLSLLRDMLSHMDLW